MLKKEKKKKKEKNKKNKKNKKKTAKKWQLKLTAADVGFNVKPKILNLCV